MWRWYQYHACLWNSFLSVAGALIAFKWILCNVRSNQSGLRMRTGHEPHQYSEFIYLACSYVYTRNRRKTSSQFHFHQFISAFAWRKVTLMCGVWVISRDTQHFYEILPFWIENMIRVNHNCMRQETFCNFFYILDIRRRVIVCIFKKKKYLQIVFHNYNRPETFTVLISFSLFP